MKHVLFDKTLMDSMWFLFYDVNGVLDVGCALGVYLNSWKERGIKRCVGIEPNPMVNYTNGVEIKTGDVTNGFELKETFDLVTNMEVVEHINCSKHAALFDFITSHFNKMHYFSGPEKEWRKKNDK